MPILPCSALVSGMFDANDLAAFQGIQIRTPGRGRHRLARETFSMGGSVGLITISRVLRATPDEASGATHSKS
jgi:hypothetical protein